MIINAMVQREDFYKINEKTLKQYYKTVYGKELEIETRGYSLFNEVLIYPRLGSIMRRLPDKKIFNFWLNEYNVRDNLIKYVLAKIYVCTCFFSFGLLAKKGLYISDKTVFDRSIAVIPANRKIRIYNFNTGFVDAIIKDTFTHRYFDNELSFRLNHCYDFVLPIIEYGENWYRERILPGQPLARIKNERLYQQSMMKAVRDMRLIAEASLEYVDVTEYATGLYSEIMRKMQMAKTAKQINCFEVVCEIAASALSKAVQLNAPVPVVESHGDLQSGNIWVDQKQEKTYILDWETHERRSIWYDCATLLLSTRRANKLKEMMNQCEQKTTKDAILLNDSKKDYDMKAVMGIITLEDIMFYLDDMMELPRNFGGDIFNRIAGELDLMGWRNI